MITGVTFLFLGLFLLPIGIIYFKQTWTEYKELAPNKKNYVLLLEMIDLFTFSSLSTWLLFISLICIAFGIVVICFVNL